jgi:charged multivesicular body protein 5
MDQRGKVI